MRRRRLQLGLTQEAIARRLGELGVEVSAQAVYHWEKDNAHVPPDYLPAIERVLKLRQGTLYRELYMNGYYGEDHDG